MNTSPGPGHDQGPSHETQESAQSYPHEPHELNITDGGEFLDDAIRMKEQPYEKITVRDNE